MLTKSEVATRAAAFKQRHLSVAGGVGAHNTMTLSAGSQRVGMVVAMKHDLVEGCWGCHMMLGSDESKHYSLKLAHASHDDHTLRLTVNPKAGDQLPVTLPFDVNDHDAQLNMLVTLDDETFAELNYAWCLEALRKVPDTQNEVQIAFDETHLPADMVLAELTLRRQDAHCAWRIIPPFKVCVKRSKPIVSRGLPSCTSHQKLQHMVTRCSKQLLDVECAQRKIHVADACCPLPDNVVLLTFDARNEYEQVLYYVQNTLITMSYYYEPPRLCAHRWAMYGALFPHVKRFYETSAGRVKTVQELDILWRTQMCPYVMSEWTRSSRSARDFFNIPADVDMQVLSVPLWGVERDRVFCKEVSQTWVATQKELRAAIRGDSAGDPSLDILGTEAERVTSWSATAIGICDVHMQATFGQWAILWDTSTDQAWLGARAESNQPLVFSTYMLQLHSELFQLRTPSQASVPLAPAVFPFEMIRAVEDSEGAKARLGKIVFRAEGIYEVVDYNEERPVMVLLDGDACQRITDLHLNLQREDFPSPLFVPFEHLEPEHRESLFVRLWHKLFGVHREDHYHNSKYATITVTDDDHDHHHYSEEEQAHPLALLASESHNCFDFSATWMTRKTAGAAAATAAASFLETVSVQLWTSVPPGGAATKTSSDRVNIDETPLVQYADPAGSGREDTFLPIAYDASTDVVTLLLLRDPSAARVTAKLEELRAQTSQVFNLSRIVYDLFERLNGPVIKQLNGRGSVLSGLSPAPRDLKAIVLHVTTPNAASQTMTTERLSTAEFAALNFATDQTFGQVPDSTIPFSDYLSRQSGGTGLFYYTLQVGLRVHSGYVLINNSDNTMRVLTCDGDVVLARKMSILTGARYYALSRRMRLVSVDTAEVRQRVAAILTAQGTELIKVPITATETSLVAATGMQADWIKTTDVGWQPNSSLLELSYRRATGGALRLAESDNYEAVAYSMLMEQMSTGTATPLVIEPRPFFSSPNVFSANSGHSAPFIFRQLLAPRPYATKRVNRQLEEDIGQRLFATVGGMFYQEAGSGASALIHRVCGYGTDGGQRYFIDETGHAVKNQLAEPFISFGPDLLNQYRIQQESSELFQKQNLVSVLGWKHLGLTDLRVNAVSDGIVQMSSERSSEHTFFASIIDVYTPRVLRKQPARDVVKALTVYPERIPDLRASDRSAAVFDIGLKLWFVEQAAITAKTGFDGSWFYAAYSDSSEPIALIGYVEHVVPPTRVQVVQPDVAAAIAAAEQGSMLPAVEGVAPRPNGIRGQSFLSMWTYHMLLDPNPSNVLAVPPAAGTPAATPGTTPAATPPPAGTPPTTTPPPGTPPPQQQPTTPQLTPIGTPPTTPTTPIVPALQPIYSGPARLDPVDQVLYGDLVVTFYALDPQDIGNTVIFAVRHVRFNYELAPNVQPEEFANPVFDAIIRISPLPIPGALLPAPPINPAWRFDQRGRGQRTLDLAAAQQVVPVVKYGWQEQSRTEHGQTVALVNQLYDTHYRPVRWVSRNTWRLARVYTLVDLNFDAQTVQRVNAILGSALATSVELTDMLTDMTQDAVQLVALGRAPGSHHLRLTMFVQDINSILQPLPWVNVEPVAALQQVDMFDVVPFIRPPGATNVEAFFVDDLTLLVDPVRFYIPVPQIVVPAQPGAPPPAVPLLPAIDATVRYGLAWQTAVAFLANRQVDQTRQLGIGLMFNQTVSQTVLINPTGTCLTVFPTRGDFRHTLFVLPQFATAFRTRTGPFPAAITYYIPARTNLPTIPALDAQGTVTLLLQDSTRGTARGLRATYNLTQPALALTQYATLELIEASAQPIGLSGFIYLVATRGIRRWMVAGFSMSFPNTLII